VSILLVIDVYSLSTCRNRKRPSSNHAQMYPCD
jgi:hypothetical protein